MAATVLSAPADAAPRGTVDTGVIIFGTQYGTGCAYPMNIAVDSSSMVTFWDQKKGHKPILIGRDRPKGALATVTWWPKREGLRRLYAVQDGKRSKIKIERVTRGYGSGGTCIAF